MPTKPPSLKPAKRRAPWQTSRQVDRLRGRAGVKDRGRIKAEEPLCRICTAAGRVAATTQVDHIKPLFEGGTDDRDNKQGLCGPCHDAKTAAERRRAIARNR